jgi:hypothetical protein
MRRITVRECYDRRWVATLEDAHETVVNPITCRYGDSSSGALTRLLMEVPDSENCPAAFIPLS